MFLECFLVHIEQTINMNNLVKQFRDILRNDCLNPTERHYLKQAFFEFNQKREIISRNSVEFIEENFDSIEWSQNNIG